MRVVKATDHFSAFAAQLLCLFLVLLMAGHTEYLHETTTSSRWIQGIFLLNLAIAVRIVGSTDHFSAVHAQLLCLFPVVLLAGLAEHLPRKHNAPSKHLLAKQVLPFHFREGRRCQ